MYPTVYRLLVIVVFLLLGSPRLNAQSSCDPTVPSFTVNLTSSPSATWLSPTVIRNGLCCSSVSPDRCLEFIITLHPSAQGIIFDIASGAIPPGAMFYQVSCGSPTPVGEIMCLNGPGPHVITFCKPGNNANTYSITSVPAPQVSPPIAVSDGCTGIIYAQGYDESTITWTSMPSNPTYNSYMSCSTACDTVTITAQPGYPPSVLYQVCGYPAGACDSLLICDTVRVYFVSDKTATILPQNPVICFGGPPATLTATGTGGAPPYLYLWSTGATTQSINVGPGTYWVEISDTTSCPPAYDTVTVIAHPSPIDADAGADLTSCANNPGVTLNGSVIVATGGQWSNGAGTYSPNDTTLNATYTPSAGEISAGSATLYLTSTGNGGCPAAMDTVVISIGPAPVVNAGPDITICADVTSVAISGTVTVATGGTWTTSGTGTFSPSANNLSTNYIPSGTDTAAGSVTLTLTSTGNGTCLPVVDTKLITFTNAPTISAGADIVVCADVTSVPLSGVVSTATGGTWTTSGTGTFTPNANTLNASYVPTSADTAAGSVTLTITSTGNGTCNAVTDQVLITFTNAPTANAGADITICADVASITLNGLITGATGGTWTTSGSGTFTPNATTLNATYNFSNGDTAAGTVVLTLTSTGNGGCNAVVDTKTVTITNAPTVNAGSDVTICADVPSMTLSGIVTTATGGTWTTSGSGTFSPNANTLNATYNFSSGDTAAGSVTLALTSTGNGTCNPVVDSIVVTITNAPTVSAVSDMTICADVTSIALGGNVATASGGIWTTSGSGSFNPNASTVNATYQPSAGDTAAGSLFLVLTTTGNGTCNAVDDSVFITITPAPTVNAGTDLTICADQDSISLSGMVTTATGGTWTTSGSGTFVPNANALNAVYVTSAGDTTAGTVTLTLTSTGNGTCNPVTDAVIITITPAPTVNAGPDQTYCSDVSSISLNGIVTTATGGTWSTSGTGTFTPNATTLNASYVPSAADTTSGSVTLTLVTTGNGGCNAVTDNLTFILTDAPTITAGADQIVCSTNPNIVLNGVVTTATGGVWTTSGSGTFVPNNTTSNVTYIPSNADTTAGSVTIVFTSTGNGTCNTVTDTMMLIITPDAISVTAGPDQTVCSSSIVLNGAVSTATGGVWTTSGSGTFTPSDSVLNPTYIFSNADTTAGTVTLVLTTTGNGGCTAKSDTITITILDLITVNGTAADTVCANVPSIPLNVSVSTGQGFWSTTGSGTFTPNNTTLNASYVPSAADTAAGIVTLWFTSTNNGVCNAVMDSMTIVLVPAPNVAFSNTSVCHNSATAFTDLTTTVGTISSWNWNFGDSNSSSAQSPNYTYGTEGSYTVTLTVTNSFGCQSSISQPVTVHPNPLANFNTAAQCFVDSVYFTDATTIVSGSVTQWNWNFGDSATSNSQNPGHAYTAPGTYTVTLIATSNFGCTDTVTQTVTAQPAPAGDFVWTSVCWQDSTIFTDSSTILFGNIVSWSWDFGDGNNASTTNTSHEYAAPGTYNVTLIVTSAFGCVDTIVQPVTVNPWPVPNFSSSVGCLNEPVVFMDLSTINPGIVSGWLWDFGDGDTSTAQNPTHQYPAVATYTVTFIPQSDEGCVDTITQTVTVNPAPVAQFDPVSIVVDPYDVINFTDLSVGNTTIVGWSWEFGDGIGTSLLQNPSYAYQAGGFYLVTEIVTNNYGCSDTIVHEVIVTQPPVVPSGFSPNGDGQNDVFYVLGGPFKELELSIYNKWGELIFVSKAQSVGWDGTRRGEPQPEGVYVYTISCVTEDGEPHFLTGDLTLLR